METVIKFTGVAEYVLDRLVSMGYFKTKTEALRAGVLGLGKEYNMISDASSVEAELAIRKMEALDAEVDAGKRKVHTLDSILRENGMRRG